MELRHLRYFVAVAEELSFTRAAARLHIGQPPLSQQIQALEAEVGAQLLERSKRWVRLTQAGALFLADARRILALSEQAVQTARRAQRGEAGELRIAYTYSTPFTPLFASVINRYRQRYPGVVLTLNEMATLRGRCHRRARNRPRLRPPGRSHRAGDSAADGAAPRRAAAGAADRPCAGAPVQRGGRRVERIALRDVSEGRGDRDLSADFQPVPGGRLRAAGGDGGGGNVGHPRPGGGRLRHLGAAGIVQQFADGGGGVPAAVGRGRAYAAVAGAARGGSVAAGGGLCGAGAGSGGRRRDGRRCPGKQFGRWYGL